MCEGRLLQAFLSLTFSVPSQSSSLNESLHHRRPGSHPAARQGTTHFIHAFTVVICPIFTQSPEECVLNRCTKCISMNRAQQQSPYKPFNTDQAFEDTSLLKNKFKSQIDCNYSTHNPEEIKANQRS